MIRINFQPNTRLQLEAIDCARLTSAKENQDGENMIEDKAIAMALIMVSVETSEEHWIYVGKNRVFFIDSLRLI